MFDLCQLGHGWNRALLLGGECADGVGKRQRFLHVFGCQLLLPFGRIGQLIEQRTDKRIATASRIDRLHAKSWCGDTEFGRLRHAAIFAQRQHTQRRPLSENGV